MNPYIYVGLDKDIRSKFIKENELIKLSEILNNVINFTGISEKQIKSKCTKRKISYPRHLFFYLAKQKNMFTLKQIGKQVGYDSHVTVLQGIETINSLLFSDKKVNTDVEKLKYICGM